MFVQVPLKSSSIREIRRGAANQSDTELDQYLTQKTMSQWHLSGTARMGLPEDKEAVVDNQGRVHGVDGLRVVDASIMPMVINGNTNSPTIMIAEKLSDAIMGVQPLPRIEAAVWSPDNSDSSGLGAIE